MKKGKEKSRKPEKKLGKKAVHIITTEELNKREVLVPSKHIFSEEPEETNPTDEQDINTTEVNDDEVTEPEYSPFELEPCFPPINRLIVDIDTLEVKPITTPVGVISNQLTQKIVESAQKTAKHLQETLHNLSSCKEINIEFFNNKFLTKPEVDDISWNHLKRNLYVLLYRNGEFIKKFKLSKILKEKGYPKDIEKECIAQKILKKYDEEKSQSFNSFVKDIWETNEKVKELWKNKEALRKYLEREKNKGGK